MKKYLIISLLSGMVLLPCSEVKAQVDLGNLLEKVKSSVGSISSSSDNDKKEGAAETLSNIFSSLKVATKDEIIGTWVYEEPAVVFNSNNLINKAGGSLMSSIVEKKLKENLEKYGFKKGSVTMFFDKDGNFTQTISGKTLRGTYIIEDKNIQLKYSGNVSQIIGTTQLDGNSLLVVMDASKLLQYVQVLGTMSKNSTLSAATSFLGNMDGMECGIRLVKQ